MYYTSVGQEEIKKRASLQSVFVDVLTSDLMPILSNVLKIAAGPRCRPSMDARLILTIFRGRGGGNPVIAKLRRG
jgi:hypothetical protein